MLDRDDLQLIQRHLDGELTPAEEGRLEVAPGGQRRGADAGGRAEVVDDRSIGKLIDPPG